LASLTGRLPRPWRGTPADLASPAPGGTGASPAPGGTGASPAPGGTGPTQYRLPPKGGANLPPPIYIRGGATIPYIYKGIVRSHSKGPVRVASGATLTGPFGTGPREGRSESIREYEF